MVKKILAILSVISIIYLSVVCFMAFSNIKATAFAIMIIFVIPTGIGITLGAIWLRHDLNRGKTPGVKPYQVGIPGCIGMAIGLFMINFIWNIL